MATSNERLKRTSVKQQVTLQNKHKKNTIGGKLGTYKGTKMSSRLKQHVSYVFIQTDHLCRACLKQRSPLKTKNLRRPKSRLKQKPYSSRSLRCQNQKHHHTLPHYNSYLLHLFFTQVNFHKNRIF